MTDPFTETPGSGTPSLCAAGLRGRRLLLNRPSNIETAKLCHTFIIT